PPTTRESGPEAGSSRAPRMPCDRARGYPSALVERHARPLPCAGARVRAHARAPLLPRRPSRFPRSERAAMKVLMLGWDFSPRLSGGVGTACRGLAQALARTEAPLGAEVLFVL